MKASEYIDKLQELIEEYGDLEVTDSYDNTLGDPEECEGTFVAADKA